MTLTKTNRARARLTCAFPLHLPRTHTPPSVFSSVSANSSFSSHSSSSLPFVSARPRWMAVCVSVSRYRRWRAWVRAGHTRLPAFSPSASHFFRSYSRSSVADPGPEHRRGGASSSSSGVESFFPPSFFGSESSEVSLLPRIRGCLGPLEYLLSSPALIAPEGRLRKRSACTSMRGRPLRS